jgi:arylsulfatase A-like enzyme
MRNWLTPLLLISLLGCGNQQPEQQAATEPPNIVVIVADDLGYNDLGVYGSEIIKSPNIDKLAADGVRLTDGYVAAAVCSPSRAGLYTGRYQPRFGYEYNPSGHDEELGLPTDQVTLADMMKEAGYATGLIGKWHQGKSREYHPLNRGFDEYFGTLAGGTSYIDSRTEGVESWPEANAPTKRPDGTAIFDGFEQVEVEEYLTDVFAAKAVDYIERHKDERFFLMLTPNTPHTPLQATTEYTDRYKHVEEPGKRIFAAMVSSLDDYVGDVVETLRKNGLEDNTLLVFLSDNGCIAYLSEPICSNAPLSGSKRFHLEGGVRVPFIFKWPAKLPKGKVYSEPAIAIDLFSTFAAAVGSDASGQDSVNLLPYLKGENTAPPHEFLFWRSKPNMAVRWGNWKMWKVNNTDKVFDDMTVSGRRLPEEDFPGGSPMGQTTVLYDLSVDIGEQLNVAGEHPEIVQRLEAELKAWDSELAEPIWKSQRSTLADLHGQMVQLFF